MAKEYSEAYSRFKQIINNASRTTQFMIELPPIGSIVNGDLLADVFDAQDLNNNVAYTVKDISIPSKSIGQIPIYYRGKQIKLPGDFNLGELVMTCYDTDKKEARRYFDTWFNATFDSFTGTRGDLATVKVDGVKIRIFNTTGKVEEEANISMEFILVGSFVMNIGEDARDWEGIDAVANFPITLSIDDMEIDYLGAQ